MSARIILDEQQLEITVERLCHQLIEVHKDFANSALIGIQPRGVPLANRIHDRLSKILRKSDIDFGKLDITFYRDDFRRHDKPITPQSTNLNFPIEDRRIILIDDVLFTGRTIRSAMDALIDYGRPADVELLVLIDRRLQRHLPIEAKYIGKRVDSIISEKVSVEWKEIDGVDNVWIKSSKSKTK